jgi:hypothetical protein
LPGGLAVQEVQPLDLLRKFGRADGGKAEEQAAPLVDAAAEAAEVKAAAAAPLPDDDGEEEEEWEEVRAHIPGNGERSLQLVGGAIRLLVPCGTM